MNYINEELENFNKFLKDKKVAVIGLGVSNIPLIDYLAEKYADISIFDNKEKFEFDNSIIEKVEKYNIKTYFGKNNLENLKGFDIIFRSPSCRPDVKEIQEEIANGAILTSEIEMVLKLAPCKVIGVTGSDGKTTTTTLIYEILKSKYNCYLGGNIGIPLFTKIKDMKPDDIVILELSSFQTINMEISPDISVITNIQPNHLDIHKSYEEYIDAKKNVFKHQTRDGLLVINYDNEITKGFNTQTNGKVIYFSRFCKLNDGVILDDDTVKICENGFRKHILNVKDVILRGSHNYENIIAAIAATKDLINEDEMIKAIKNFKGVEHRLELVKTINNVNWYNDSIGTSPSRTIAGLKAFDEDIVLIAGGYDKNLDYTPMAEPVFDKVTKLILMGATSEKIYNAVYEKVKDKVEIYKVKTLADAVNKAYNVATDGEIVLFSPASASFDMFKNFAERGKAFKELVNKIK